MFAVLYDVHGNLPALEAVLADAGAVDGYLLGGDYALFGGWPLETVQRLQALASATWIRGNVDRWTATPSEAPDDERVQRRIAECATALGEELTQRLGGLPERTLLADTTFVHGSPLSDVRSFLPAPADTDDELLAGEAPARLVFGHTHLAFARAHGPTQLINPGSVGVPLDGDTRAAYGLLDGDRFEHRRVAYDHHGAAAKVRALGDEVIARRIERAEP